MKIASTPNRQTQARRPTALLTACAMACLTAIGLAGCGGGGSDVPSHAVGGTISGAAVKGFVLQVGSQTLSVQAGATTFEFSPGVAEGGTYEVTVKTQPPVAKCTVSNGQGTMGTSAVSNVTVSCTDELVYSLVHEFNKTTEGDSPVGALLVATDGSMYGTLYQGGAFNSGSVFKLDPTGTVSVVYALDQAGKGDGRYPYGSLSFGADGSLYGTTSEGGALQPPAGKGTIFKLSTAGSFTRLASYGSNTIDGATSFATLLNGGDGWMYGATAVGGASDLGTLFKVSATGTYVKLHDFLGGVGDGAVPQASVIKGADGALYGMTDRGGAADGGTIFRMTPDGAFSIVASVPRSGSGVLCGQVADLVLTMDGWMYGVCSRGGSSNRGYVFKVHPTLGFEAVYHFVDSTGSSPTGQLLFAGDGKLYGVTNAGGLTGLGAVFRLSLDGSYKLLHSFTTGAGGYGPYGGLTQGVDGHLYGTTSNGAGSFGGGIFRLAPQ